ncbi:alpha/beta hydrolase [Streptomyces sp. ISL-36]|uniref:RBBP9/YdeN family alpha/beta hydrolase n=1 Tax=Streptomyces sp. ISL-36 TaxID=2819182 RepID=UPI001BED17F5|nr:alpha/beta hydrolase [Streptomyces sp. ISL-36]MBT2441115.1 alpha/beta hydrolase [Streptomyces sp. ISL-36]
MTTAPQTTAPQTTAPQTTAPKTFLILHGFQNHRPEGHWQHWLAGRLRERGHQVRYPQLPEPDAPVLAGWLDALRTHLHRPGNGEFVVVAHSLSVLLWLHAASRTPDDLPVDRVLLVAPPSPAVTASFREIAGFAEGLDLDAVRLKAPVRLVYGGGDPYCPEGAAVHYGDPLSLDRDLVLPGGHLDMHAGYGEWPSVLEWCENPSVRLRAR